LSLFREFLPVNFQQLSQDKPTSGEARDQDRNVGRDQQRRAVPQNVDY
jgi:hypothetical protein